MKLTLRQLNRATLARQLLLDRASMEPVAAVEHLVGLQAQTPQSWYIGLWSRLARFDATHVGRALEQRRLVRIPAMRSTIHLLSSDDALGLRPLMQPAVDRTNVGSFGRELADLDRDAVVKAAREFVEEQPRLASELGRFLATRFPGREPFALSLGARAWLPMVQVPPRGVWRRSGPARQAPLDTWLGRPLVPAPIDDVVLRYLAAFGPATVRDVQIWCGLTKLAEVVDRLRDHLVTFTDEDGRELFDLPAAPRPNADTPASPLFLYDYDNLLLSHADRRRVLGDVGSPDYAGHGYAADSNRQPSSLLVDGFVAGTWEVTRTRGKARLTVRRFRRFTTTERDAITAEGSAVLAFLHPRDDHDVRVE